MSAHKFPLGSTPPQIQTVSGSRIDAKAYNFPTLKNLSVSELTILPKGFREPHWHPNAHELSYVQEGKALITLFGVKNTHHTFILEPGQLGFVPMGTLHSIENMGGTPLKMWVAFSHEAPEDFEISAAINGMPDNVLGKTFQKPPTFFSHFKKSFKSGFISSQNKIREPELSAEVSAYKMDLEGLLPQLQTAGGWVKMSNGFLFPVLEDIAVYSLSLAPGGAREPHWHPNAAELNILVSGTARITLLSPNGGTETFDMGPGDISFMPQGYIHHIENTGSIPARYVIFFAHASPSDIGLSGCLGGFPNDMYAALFNLAPHFLDSLPKFQKDLFIVGGG